MGHPGIGAAVGGTLGLGAGALIGDQLQGQEVKQAEQQKALDQQRAEIAKNQALIEELKNATLRPVRPAAALWSIFRVSIFSLTARN